MDHVISRRGAFATAASALCGALIGRAADDSSTGAPRLGGLVDAQSTAAPADGSDARSAATYRYDELGRLSSVTSYEERCDCIFYSPADEAD